MANQYDTNLKLQAIADAIGDSQSSGLIQALEDISDAVAGGGGGGSSAAGLVSDAFSELRTYDVGEYCIYNNTLYKCINAIVTPGSWVLSDWEATNAGKEFTQVNSDIIKIKTATIPLLTAGSTWSPTAKAIGTLTTLFGLTQSQIVFITAENTQFSPATNIILSMYNDTLYGATTQTSTLSSDVLVKIGYIS